MNAVTKYSQASQLQSDRGHRGENESDNEETLILAGTNVADYINNNGLVQLPTRLFKRYTKTDPNLIKAIVNFNRKRKQGDVESESPETR